MENTSQEGRRSKPSDTDVEYNHDSHLQLRGQDPIGSCTATEAKYLMQLCDSIPGNIIKRIVIILMSGDLQNEIKLIGYKHTRKIN